MSLPSRWPTRRDDRVAPAARLNPGIRQIRRERWRLVDAGRTCPAVQNDPVHEEQAMTDVRNHANLIWGIAELLRGDYKQADYGKVILPLVVIRRLDQALEPTKEKVVARAEQLRAEGIENVEPALVRVVGAAVLQRVAADADAAARRRAEARAATCASTSTGSRRSRARSSTSSTSTARSTSSSAADLLYQVDRADLRRRPASGSRLQPGDGLHLRGADPQVRRGVATRRPASTSRRARSSG